MRIRSLGNKADGHSGHEENQIVLFIHTHTHSLSDNHFSSLLQTFVHDLKSEPEILPLVTLVSGICAFGGFMCVRTLQKNPDVYTFSHVPNWVKQEQHRGKPIDRAENA